MRLRELLVALALLLLLCVDGWGCGSQPDASEPPGWCCEGFCGLSGEDANTFDSCSCAGVVSHNPERRGECRTEES